MQHTSHWIVGTSIFVICAYVGVTHYYHFGEGVILGKKTAAWIVENNKDPKECDRIILFSIFPGPSQAEIRNRCYLQVAMLLRDTAICTKYIGEHSTGCVNMVEAVIQDPEGNSYLYE